MVLGCGRFGGQKISAKTQSGHGKPSKEIIKRNVGVEKDPKWGGPKAVDQDAAYWRLVDEMEEKRDAKLVPTPGKESKNYSHTSKQVEVVMLSNWDTKSLWTQEGLREGTKGQKRA